VPSYGLALRSIPLHEFIDLHQPVWQRLAVYYTLSRPRIGHDCMKNWLNPLTPATESLRQQWDGMVNRALDRTVRLAVTGLRRSGKTVFITSLVNQLVHGADSARLPFFELAGSGRLLGTRRQLSHDLYIPAFRYDAALEALAQQEWPGSTDKISEIRLAIRYQPHSSLLRKLSPVHTLYLEIIDYPGEWLLDLPLLELDFNAWSRYIGELCERAPRSDLSQPWREYLAGLDPNAEAEERHLREAARLYTEFLHRCKDKQYGLTLLQPGRFTMPGDLAGAPALEFCPLLNIPVAPRADSLYAEMKKRYEGYKEHVVKKFYHEHFMGFDRQIVVVDVLQAFNLGYETFVDMRNAMEMVLKSFHYGKSGFFNRLFNMNLKIDKLLFAASKADHVTPEQLPNLESFLQKMLVEARGNALFEGVETDTVALAAVKSTQAVKMPFQGQQLSCIKGTAKEADKAIALFPGEVPLEIPAPGDWIAGRFNFVEFRPPRLTDAHGEGFPHIRMDRAMQFLLGDKF